jgi:ABC-type branched-subunit amino acid transport system permease subunit/ABC-type branched-subunit amino acid transport system ATPase component
MSANDMAGRAAARRSDIGGWVAGLLAERRRRTALIGSAVFVVLLLWSCVFATSFQQYLLGQVLIFGLSALGLDWLMGRAGQVSVGNGALMAVGAFLTGAIADKSWAPFPVPLIIAGLAGGAVGFLIGIPSLRLKGIYFALVTLALQFIVVFAAQQYEQRTNQVSGVTVAPPSIGGYSFTPGPAYLIMLAAIVGIVMILLYRTYGRMPGRAWMAIKESELAASTIQVDVRAWKLKAFVGSSMIISVAGSLLAYYTGLVSSDTFSLEFAITFVAMTIIGGVGSMSGALFGAAVVTLAPQALSGLSSLNPGSLWLSSNLPVIQNGIYGLLVLLVLLFLPKGVLPSLYDLAVKLRHRRSPKTPSAAGSRSAQRLAVQDRPVAPATPTRANGPDRLLIRDLDVRYSNGARALIGVNLGLEFGRTIAVVGRNGAGKSTLLRSIGGFFATENVSTRGSISLGEREILGASPLSTSKLGVVLVPERDKIFPSLTVAEHLKYIGDVDAAREAIPEAWPIIEKRWRSEAGLLSGGERQLVALAMAASLRPRLLLIDEMSLGLAPVMIAQVTEAIAQLQSHRAMSIIIVEQNVVVATGLADRVYQLASGVLGPHEQLSELAATEPALEVQP